jgi:hypothetical protein
VVCANNHPITLETRRISLEASDRPAYVTMTKQGFHYHRRSIAKSLSNQPPHLNTMSTERPELVSSRFIQSEPLTASPPSSPPPAHTASHHRKSHRSSGGSRRSKSDSLSQHERSPSPTQTYIPGSGSGFLPKVLPTTSLLSSIPGAAHYSSTATSGQVSRLFFSSHWKSCMLMTRLCPRR